MELLVTGLASFFLMLEGEGAAAEAKPRKAECVIRSNGAAEFRGPCLFHAGEKGSFTIEAASKRKPFPQASSISLYMMAKDVGDVRGITRDGINSRWGRAIRSRRERACWNGSDFSICVY